ncbi:MAG: PEP-CTERM sorting domain-containing protein [Gemmataceae bacterium]|nr:PEP-CTERM sorting domain-containing protein [Gemmataceae bacterium]
MARGILALALLLGWAGSAPAALLAYDGFAYPPGGDLQGNAGGFGFAGPWVPGGFNASVFDHLDVAPGSLGFGGLLTSGNRATSGPVFAGIGGLTRDLAAPLGADNTTVYLSVLLRPEGVLNEGLFNGFFGLTLETPAEPELFIGKPGADALGEYVVEQRGGAFQVSSGVPVVVGETALLVLKAEFLPGHDRFTLYVNPTPGGPEPGAGAVNTALDLPTVTGLTIYSTGAFSVDEIRVGMTFADVTPVAPAAVPEPAGLTLAGIAAAGLALRRRRR